MLWVSVGWWPTWRASSVCGTAGTPLAGCHLGCLLMMPAGNCILGMRPGVSSPAWPSHGPGPGVRCRTGSSGGDTPVAGLPPRPPPLPQGDLRPCNTGPMKHGDRTRRVAVKLSPFCTASCLLGSGIFQSPRALTLPQGLLASAVLEPWMVWGGLWGHVVLAPLVSRGPVFLPGSEARSSARLLGVSCLLPRAAGKVEGEGCL